MTLYLVKKPSFINACPEKYKEFCESGNTERKCIRHCNNYSEGSSPFLRPCLTKGLLKSPWTPVRSVFFLGNSFLLKSAQKIAQNCITSFISGKILVLELWAKMLCANQIAGFFKT